MNTAATHQTLGHKIFFFFLLFTFTEMKGHERCGPISLVLVTAVPFVEFLVTSVLKIGSLLDG